MSARAGTADPKVRLPPALSLRETDCVERLVLGLTDQEIARELAITRATVRFHLKSARSKVGARSRAHMAALAVALGIASLSSDRPAAETDGPEF